MGSFVIASSRRTCFANKVQRNQVRNIAPPFSLRLGHRTALVLLTPFTTVLPLRYPWEACQAGQILAGSAKKAEPWLCLFLFAIVGYGYSMHPADYFLKILTRSANFFFLMTNHTTESPPMPTTATDVTTMATTAPVSSFSDVSSGVSAGGFSAGGSGALYFHPRGSRCRRHRER